MVADVGEAPPSLLLLYMSGRAGPKRPFIGGAVAVGMKRLWRRGIKNPRTRRGVVVPYYGVAFFSSSAFALERSKSLKN